MVNPEVRLIIFFAAEDAKIHLTIQFSHSVVSDSLQPHESQHTIKLPVRSSLPVHHHLPIQSAKTRPGADCGSYRELFIAKFRLKSKKVRKITRPFRSDLNQIYNNV